MVNVLHDAVEGDGIERVGAAAAPIVISPFPSIAVYMFYITVAVT